MQYPHMGPIIVDGFLHSLQYIHIGSHNSGWFFTFIAIPHMGPIIITIFFHSLQTSHFVINLIQNNNQFRYIKKQILGTQITY
jgi:hypothetical protein